MILSLLWKKKKKKKKKKWSVFIVKPLALDQTSSGKIDTVLLHLDESMLSQAYQIY